MSLGCDIIGRVVRLLRSPVTLNTFSIPAVSLSLVGLWALLKDHLGTDKHSREYEPLLLKARHCEREPSQGRER